MQLPCEAACWQEQLAAATQAAGWRLPDCRAPWERLAMAVRSCTPHGTAASEEELRYALGLTNMTTGKGKVDLKDSNIRPMEIFMCSVVSAGGGSPLWCGVVGGLQALGGGGRAMGRWSGRAGVVQGQQCDAEEGERSALLAATVCVCVCCGMGRS